MLLKILNDNNIIINLSFYKEEMALEDESDYDRNTEVSYILNWLLVLIEVVTFMFTLYVGMKVICITKCGDHRSVILVVFVNLTLLSSIMLHIFTETIH